MSGRLESWLQRRWYGGVPPGPGLRLLSMVYGRALALRRLAYRRGLCRTLRIGVPVIVVGNLVAGGTGKTPVVIALTRALQARGWRVGVVSRGHGRHSHEPVLVRPETPVEQCGDEPMLIARQTRVPVYVDSDRAAAARRLVAQGCNLIVADDGLQHLRLGRDIEIEVIDGHRQYGNARLLPAGPLREPLRPLEFRLFNGGVASEDDCRFSLEAADAQSLQGAATRPLATFVGETVHAVAGIGNPQRFFETLRAAGLEIVEHIFPDHHGFRREDFSFPVRGAILMTEKDAVKCQDFHLDNAWYVPVSTQLPEAFLGRISDRLRDWSPAHG